MKLKQKSLFIFIFFHRCAVSTMPKKDVSQAQQTARLKIKQFSKGVVESNESEVGEILKKYFSKWDSKKGLYYFEVEAFKKICDLYEKNNHYLEFDNDFPEDEINSNILRYNYRVSSIEEKRKNEEMFPYYRLKRDIESLKLPYRMLLLKKNISSNEINKILDLYFKSLCCYKNNNDYTEDKEKAIVGIINSICELCKKEKISPDFSNICINGNNINPFSLICEKLYYREFIQLPSEMTMLKKNINLWDIDIVLESYFGYLAKNIVGVNNYLVKYTTCCIINRIDLICDLCKKNNIAPSFEKYHLKCATNLFSIILYFVNKKLELKLEDKNLALDSLPRKILYLPYKILELKKNTDYSGIDKSLKAYFRILNNPQKINKNSYRYHSVEHISIDIISSICCICENNSINLSFNNYKISPFNTFYNLYFDNKIVKPSCEKINLPYKFLLLKKDKRLCDFEEVLKVYFSFYSLFSQNKRYYKKEIFTITNNINLICNLCKTNNIVPKLDRFFPIGASPLAIAIEYIAFENEGSLELPYKLIELGSRVNYVAKNPVDKYNTPLTATVELLSNVSEDSEINYLFNLMKILISKGAEINLNTAFKKKYHPTHPLVIALKNKHISYNNLYKVVYFLIRNGANTNYIDNVPFKYMSSHLSVFNVAIENFIYRTDKVVLTKVKKILNNSLNINSVNEDKIDLDILNLLFEAGARVNYDNQKIRNTRRGRSVIVISKPPLVSAICKMHRNLIERVYILDFLVKVCGADVNIDYYYRNSNNQICVRSPLLSALAKFAREVKDKSKYKDFFNYKIIEALIRLGADLDIPVGNDLNITAHNKITRWLGSERNQGKSYFSNYRAYLMPLLSLEEEKKDRHIKKNSEANGVAKTLEDTFYECEAKIHVGQQQKAFLLKRKNILERNINKIINSLKDGNLSAERFNRKFNELNIFIKKYDSAVDILSDEYDVYVDYIDIDDKYEELKQKKEELNSTQELESKDSTALNMHLREKVRDEQKYTPVGDTLIVGSSAVNTSIGIAAILNSRAKDEGSQEDESYQDEEEMPNNSSSIKQVEKTEKSLVENEDMIDILSCNQELERTQELESKDSTAFSYQLIEKESKSTIEIKSRSIIIFFVCAFISSLLLSLGMTSSNKKVERIGGSDNLLL